MPEVRYVPQEDNENQLNVVVNARCKGVIIPTEGSYQFVRYEDGEVFSNDTLDALKTDISALFT